MSVRADQRGDWPIGRALSWAADDFARRGIETARLDAEVLLADVLGVERVELIIDAKRPLEESELAAFREAIQRRRRFEPVAYIVGRREFYGLPLYVDRRVLVPRPDTEALVEVALERTRSRDMHGNAVDLCTGSGCVAVAFAKQRPTWRVAGTDVSEAAIEVARLNAQRLGAVWGVRFAAGDLFEPLDRDEKFNLVVANPPYIARAEMAKLRPDIRDHEPPVALEGGPDGLDVIRRIIDESPSRLFAGGVLALEVGAGQAPRAVERFERAGFTDIDVRQDYGGIERVVSGLAPRDREKRPGY